jgi:hypothetical protein
VPEGDPGLIAKPAPEPVGTPPRRDWRSWLQAHAEWFNAVIAFAPFLSSILLSVGAIAALFAEQDLLAAIDPLRATPDQARLEKRMRRAQQFGHWFPSLRISPRRWAWLAISATTTGIIVHAIIVNFAYTGLLAATLDAKPNFLDSYLDNPTPDQLSRDLKARFSLTNNDLLKRVGALRPGTNGKPIALTMVTELVASPACQQCQEGCQKALPPVFARLLSGWPSKTLDQDQNFIKDIYSVKPPPPESPSTTKEEFDAKVKKACLAIGELGDQTLWIPNLWNRTDPWPAPRLAEAILGVEKCYATEHDECALITRLFQSTLDNSGVRLWRAAGVNFFYGWERTLVIVLVILLAEVLLYHTCARLLLSAQYCWVQLRLATAESTIASERDRLQNKQASLEKKTLATREECALDLRTGFEATFLSSANAQDREEPIHALVRSAEVGLRYGDGRYVDETARAGLSEIDTSREVIGALVTIFPVIGFAATLLSLVFALAGANQIATSNGDARSAVILQVTALLSSCFATTFLALVSMAFFAVMNLLQGTTEKQILTGIVERINTVIRPGHR